MTDDVEIIILWPDPDRLTRIKARYLGAVERRSFVVPTVDAERVVLAEWAAQHAAALGFAPTWARWSPF